MMISPYIFDKNSWFKRQSIKDCVAYDTLQISGDLRSNLDRATIMAKLALSDTLTLAVFTDYSVILARPYKSVYLMLPDVVRLKRSKAHISLSAETTFINSSRRFLRVQNGDSPSVRAADLKADSVFLQQLKTDAQALVDQPTPRLHTNWANWSPALLRPWQHPLLPAANQELMLEEAAFVARQLGLETPFSITLPAYVKGTISAFTQVTEHSSPAMTAFIACMNDDTFIHPTQAVFANRQSKKRVLVDPRKANPSVSHHRLMTLAQLAHHHLSRATDT